MSGSSCLRGPPYNAVCAVCVGRPVTIIETMHGCTSYYAAERQPGETDTYADQCCTSTLAQHAHCARKGMGPHYCHRSCFWARGARVLVATEAGVRSQHNALHHSRGNRHYLGE